jgi:hypothetical protein
MLVSLVVCAALTALGQAALDRTKSLSRFAIFCPA